MSARTIGGLWVMCDDLGERVDHMLHSEKGTVSMFLSTSILAANNSVLAFVSRSDATIDYIAVATAGKRAGDVERKVAFGPAVQLPYPVRIEQAIGELPPRFSRSVVPPRRRVIGISSASWDVILGIVIRLSSVNHSEVKRLKDVVASRQTMKRLALPDAIDFERDATAISLEAFRGSRTRQRYMSACPISDSAPFIKALEKSGANVLEDRMIDNDLASFPGAQAMRRHMVGAVRIETDSGSLTILNANRTGIEHTLGVDLIYFHHIFNSFTLVQYKRMTGNRHPIYRPNADASYHEEISRMRSFSSRADNDEEIDLLSYRMESNPFFFKFCAAQRTGYWGRMLQGMYIPLRLWETFIESDLAKGPKGGRIIGFDNAQRWLNNSEFVRLIRGGWIGSHGADSESISEIIERELSANKSLIAAVHREEKSPDEYLRDSRGRFASESDPDAM